MYRKKISTYLLQYSTRHNTFSAPFPMQIYSVDPADINILQFSRITVYHRQHETIRKSLRNHLQNFGAWFVAILTAARRKSSKRRFITSLHGNSPSVRFDEFPRARDSIRSVAQCCLSPRGVTSSNINRTLKGKRTRCTFNKEICHKAAGIRRKTARKYPCEYDTTAAVLW